MNETVIVKPAEHVVLGEVQPGVWRSRFGFHPCSFETYTKLKRLYKEYWIAVHQYADWKRWDRKQVQNRVIRKWKRNDKGQKIGCEIVGPRPEPKLNDLFCMIKSERRRRKGTTVILFEDVQVVDDWGVLAALDAARTPVANPEGVSKLGMSVEYIDSLLNHLLSFANDEV